MKREIELNARLIVTVATIGFLLSFFIARTTQTFADVRKLLADISIFMMFYSFTLWHKKYQQLFGFIIYTLLFNIDLLERGFFVCDTPVARFLKYYSFALSIIAAIIFFPTLTDKYQLKPLTNRAQISDIKITGLVIIYTVAFQALIRLM